MRHTEISVPRVGLILRTSVHHGREMYRGILDYVSDRALRWHIETVPADFGYPPDALRTTDGLIMATLSPDWERDVRRRRRPAVNVADTPWRCLLPSVIPDNLAIGEMAAQHLLDQGLRRFGFVGRKDNHPSDVRFKGFAARLAHAQPEHTPQSISIPIPQEQDPMASLKNLSRWLTALPKPAGVFCFNDVMAHEVLGACDAAGLSVPDEVAVIGADNDDLLCHATPIGLSSVDNAGRRLGREAAALLDRLMRGEDTPAKPILVPPVCVVRRQSTDIIAADDAIAAAAARFIRDHIHEPFTVKDMLAHLKVSRRSVERRFAKAYGRGIHEHTMRERIDRVKTLLLETNLPMERVADESGFNYAAHMTHAFRKATGDTPSAYRRTHK